MKSTAPPHVEQKTFNQLGIALIVISSGLLGIWAVRDTIALRNILLVLGSVLSLIYWHIYFKIQKKLSYPDFKKKHFIDFLPIILIGCMFLWVILHYLLYSQNPEKQFSELGSTWLRAFMASIIGFGCSLALHRNQSISWLLAIGLVMSFLVLFIQYIQKAVVNGNLLAIDFTGYIYLFKYNGVLAGIILFSIAFGFLIDRTRGENCSRDQINLFEKKFNNAMFFMTIFFGMLLPVYSFIFIFSSKNGIIVTSLLILFWYVFGFFYLLNSLVRSQFQFDSNIAYFKRAIIFILITTIFLFLSYQHIKINPGWKSLIDDIKISVQVNKYENWKSLSNFGYPKHENGESVAENTYERVAWAVVGFRLISENPLGNGLLRSLPSQMSQSGIDFNDAAYTHSGWIDLGLSYGWPGLLLLPIALILSLIMTIKNYYGLYRATSITIIISILSLYLVGEYAFQHGIEILLFTCSLVTFLYNRQ